MSVRVSLRGMLKLVQIDTLRRFHNVGFLLNGLYVFHYLCVSIVLNNLGAIICKYLQNYCMLSDVRKGLGSLSSAKGFKSDIFTMDMYEWEQQKRYLLMV